MSSSLTRKVGFSGSSERHPLYRFLDFKDRGKPWRAAGAEALHPWLGSNSHTLPHQPDEPNDLRGSSAAISPKKTNLRKIERYSRQCTIFSMSLPPFGTRQAFMSRRRALFPRDVFLRSVTSWYHSSNR